MEGVRAMMVKRHRMWILILGAFVAGPCGGQGPPELRLVGVTFDLARPVGMAPAGDGSGRCYILEQRGTVRVFNSLTGRMEPGFLLDIRARVLSPEDGVGNGERGLLGIAFPPGFGGEGKRHFYANYTSAEEERRGDTVVARYSLVAGDDRAADASSEEVLLEVDQPNSNHNGGQMNFGADGMLYLAFGDGGGGNDPGERSQDPQNFLGKMLRIDVEGPADPGKAYRVPADNPFVEDGRWLPEIWAYGLRNPWRWSFDRVTGDLWIGDVGQNRFEEVCFVAAGSGGGMDFGWDFYEASFRNTEANGGVAPAFETTSRPVFEYGRSLGTSVTGGYVYRGARFPRMYGRYWVADYTSGRVWMVEPDGVGSWASAEAIRSFVPAAFGEDEDGELYLLHYGSGTDGRLSRMEDSRDAGYLQVVGSGFVAGTERFGFEWGVRIGGRYRVQRSVDLEVWEDVGEVMVATVADGFRLGYEEGVSDGGVGRRYYRIVESE